MTRLRKLLRLAVGLALVPAGLVATNASAETDVVRTDAGLVRGKSADGARVFNGIPYAAPPVGPLRWKAPQPVRPWDGVREAVDVSSACPQQARPSLWFQW